MTTPATATAFDIALVTSGVQNQYSKSTLLSRRHKGCPLHCREGPLERIEQSAQPRERNENSEDLDHGRRPLHYTWKQELLPGTCDNPTIASGSAPVVPASASTLNLRV